MKLALPMPEQAMLPTDEQFSDALIEYVVSRVELLAAMR